MKTLFILNDPPYGVSVKLEALFTAGRICAEGNAGGCLRSAASRDGG